MLFILTLRPAIGTHKASMNLLWNPSLFSYGTSDTEVENDDDTNQIEYEIDSGEEEERPPQVVKLHPKEVITVD